tara:strand:- start:4375 stop:5394 length:1020 start_codon:yes stop_codon:yes gene_type:complete
MGTFNTFYINASNLSSASAVYTDEEMTTLAPSGYYSDGVVIREQLSAPNSQGQILVGDVSNNCESCTTSCSDEVLFSPPSDFTGPATLRGSVSFGSDTGAIKVEIRGVSTKPIGVDLQFDGVKYNGFASSSALASVNLYQAPLPTVTSYFWTNGSGGTSNCSNWNSTLINVPKLHFNSVSGLWEEVGNAGGLLITNKLATGFSSYGAGKLIRYIPKNTVANNLLDVEFVLPCGSSSLEVGPVLAVSCPQSLTLIVTSASESSHSNACSSAMGISRYIGPVVSQTSGVLAVGDFIFNNSVASITTADGYYRAVGTSLQGISTQYGSFRVQGGLVTEIQSC